MSSLGVAGGAGASPSPVDAPVRIVHAKMASQLSPTARAVSVANGLPTLVCGWFAAACSRLFAERIAPYPDAVPLEVVLTAMRDIRTESVLHPLVEEAMRSTRAWRDAYIAANPAEFKAPDVHLGGSITPTDPSTIRGFSECPAGSWEVSDILRQAGSEPCWQHGVSYLRMVAITDADSASLYAVSQSIACERETLADEVPFRPGGRMHDRRSCPWFIDLGSRDSPLVQFAVHDECPAVVFARNAAGEGGVVARPAALLSPAEYPVLAAAAESCGKGHLLPRSWILGVTGHFTAAMAVRVGPPSPGVSEEAIAAVLADPLLSDFAELAAACGGGNPLPPGRYVIGADSLIPRGYADDVVIGTLGGASREVPGALQMVAQLAFGRVAAGKGAVSILPASFLPA